MYTRWDAVDSIVGEWKYNYILEITTTPIENVTATTHTKH
jgi:hypothetical protein